LLWARKLYFRVSAPGQAASVIDDLKAKKVAKNKAPRFLLSTDGNEFSVLDTKTDEPLHFDFEKLNDHFDFFLPLAGIDKYEAVDENPADIKAAGRLAKFHDEIIKHNPDWHTPEKRHALDQFMTRVLFCL
jgi:MmeI, N-terminal domain